MTHRDPDDESTITGDAAASLRGGAARPSNERLRKLASFSGLGTDVLAALESSMVERTFDAGDALMRQGDDGDCLMVVQEGEVEVAVTVENERHVLKRAGGGEIFGEMALLTREPRTASVVALTPVRALVLPVEDFHRLARAEPALTEVLSRLTAQRLGGETHDALSGKVFHGYRIRGRLGRGGMAVVYEAEHVATGRRVAIKMMSHRLVFRESSRRRFQHEADIIESFDHENIARMVGRFEAFHTFFIVMEHCDGSSLDRVLAEGGPIDAPDVRRILGQLASALAYAHARRVVHLDIKPSNVMVNRDGIVKLMDFGVASPPSAAKEGTERTIVGTLPYMAPEQLAGEPCGVAADVYAVGGLAWEMLTGKRLFPGEDFVSLRNQHLAWSLPDIASALPGIAADLREFLLRSLAQDPDARTVNLREVASWAGRVNYGKLTGRAR
jgi:CRP-like cAMP-binding protein